MPNSAQATRAGFLGLFFERFNMNNYAALVRSDLKYVPLKSTWQNDETVIHELSFIMVIKSIGFGVDYDPDHLQNL